MRLRKYYPAALCIALHLAIFPWSAAAQATVPQANQLESTAIGIVVSSSAHSLVMKNDAGVYSIYIYDRYTLKPPSIPAGARVRVVSRPSGEAGIELATNVFIAAPPAAPSTTQPAEADVVPVQIRHLESQIERQSRKFGFGVRAGAALDPEEILVGVHAKFGPFFSRDFSFRPNVEFGFGEVTRQFQINLEGVYRLPFTPRQAKWSAYFGAGPTLGFAHQDFVRAAEGDNGIDFGDFSFKGGLNILTGIEFRSGMFMEVKTTVYASPHLRFLIGYTF